MSWFESVLDPLARLQMPGEQGPNIYLFLEPVSAGGRATGQIAAYPAANGIAGLAAVFSS
jgi:hypothetical protein